jgi:D-hexose-6-phosphate mutarotase
MQGPFVIWLDNYSNLYHRAMVDSIEGTYRDCLWAVEAVMEANLPASVTFRLRKDSRDMFTPALPVDLFSDSAVAQLTKSFVEACSFVGEQYFEISLVNQYQVTNVPPKPIVGLNSPQALKEILDDRNSSLDKFHPRDLYPLNPASDIDLVKIIALKQRSIESLAIPSYVPILADVNIFNRALKVIQNICHSSC